MRLNATLNMVFLSNQIISILLIVFVSRETRIIPNLFLLYENQLAGYYSKKCPRVKAPPRPPVKRGPPPPSPRPPPPPYTPPKCRVPYNSTGPYGFFYFIYGVYLNRDGFVVKTTNFVDVWPTQGSEYRCANHCKAYKWGFLVSYDKYANVAYCGCITAPMTYEIGPSVSGYGINYFSKSCPSKKGGHPPGVGRHPPGVGKRI